MSNATLFISHFCGIDCRMVAPVVTASKWEPTEWVAEYLTRRATLGSHKLQHLLPVLGLKIVEAATGAN